MAVLLDGFEGDADLDVVRERVGEFFTFGTSALLRELLELAASAFLACGASSVDRWYSTSSRSGIFQSGLSVATQRTRSVGTRCMPRLSSRRVWSPGTPRGGGPTIFGRTRSTQSWRVRAAWERRQLPVATICIALGDDVLSCCCATSGRGVALMGFPPIPLFLEARPCPL